MLSARESKQYGIEKDYQLLINLHANEDRAEDLLLKVHNEELNMNSCKRLKNFFKIKTERKQRLIPYSIPCQL